MHTRSRLAIVSSIVLVAMSLPSVRAATPPATPQGVITAKGFLDIGGTSVNDLTGNAKFPDNPDVVFHHPYFEWNPAEDINTPANNAYGENYGAQMVGYFYPPTSGDYIFYLAADDGANLYLSTDADPANKKLIAQESGWSNPRSWDTVGGGSTVEAKNSSTFTGTEWPTKDTANGGAKITLQANKPYYIEALVKEAGGGDNLAVSTDANLPIEGRYLSSFDKNTGPLAIVTQPQNQTINQGDDVTFRVVVDGTPPYTYQWRKNGTPITDATSDVYRLTRVPASENNAKYSVAITGAQGNLTSSEATLTVSSDTAPPTLVSANGSVTFDSVSLTFSEPLDQASAETAANYKLSGGVTVTSAKLAAAPGTAGDNKVTLTTSTQTEGQTLTLTLNNVKDAAGNAIAANSTLDFKTFIFSSGFVLHKFWDNSTGNNIQALRDDPRFPNSPTFSTIEPRWEYGPDGSNESGSNYGNQIIGWFTPDRSGNYIFYISGDDPVELYLSSDETPANKHLIAREPQWNNARQWTITDRRDPDVPENRSDKFAETEWTTGSTITLQAGKRYYLESLHTEGGGGDSQGATFSLEGEPEPANGDAPRLTGVLIGTFLDPNGAQVTITQQPTDQTVLQNRTATLNAAATGTSAYGPNVVFQWQRANPGSSDFANITGATSAAFTTPALQVSESGVKYRVLATVPTLTSTSSVATVTVNADTLAPKITSAAPTGLESILVGFDEPLDKATAEAAANYTISGGITISKAVQSAGGDTVLLTTSALTPNQDYTLTVGGVKDAFNNAVAAGTQFPFKAVVISYADIILADGPVAFYRFDETSGAVAKNSGSKGGDGAYYTGDESTAGEGGTPSSAKGDPGPRPPEFLGFTSGNNAATFGGADTTQDWVDTKNKFLDHLRAFTLEYWVKPVDRVGADPAWNRIGLVGQNDAIEYGFINGTTIQIWTPNGGALDTAYPFPDNEWHHVATIADGRNIKNYFDGKLVGTAGSTTSDYGSSTYNVHIGGSGVFDVTGNYFKGQLDEVAIFDKAIPAERVAIHFKAGKEGYVPPATGATFSSIRITSGQVTIAWEGTATLEEATSVTGPWSASASQANPQNVAPIGTKFFRLRL